MSDKDEVSVWGLKSLKTATSNHTEMVPVEQATSSTSEDEGFGELETELVGASVFGALFGRP